MPGRNAPINPDNLVRAKNHSVGSVLDLGSGNVDLADTTVDIDENTNPDIVHDLEKFPYPFEENEYETCWLIHILEHLEKPDKALKEAKRIASDRVIAIIPIGERDDPDHKRVYMPDDMERFNPDTVEKSGMGGFIDAVMVWRL